MNILNLVPFLLLKILKQLKPWVIFFIFPFFFIIYQFDSPSPPPLISFAFSFPAASITDITSNIIAQNPPKEILDEVYEVVENLEVWLLCLKTCGEGPSVILVHNLHFYYFVCTYASKFLSIINKIRVTTFKLEYP